jgi:hypothetical protein
VVAGGLLKCSLRRRRRPRTATKEQTPMPLDLQQYRDDAERFLVALEQEMYGHFSGQKEVCDTAAVYERHPDLFTAASVADLDRLYGEAKDDDKRRLAYLLAFAVDGHMGDETRLLGDEIANTEGQTAITVDGERIGLRASLVALANEADRARRQRIQAARVAATAEHLNPLLDRLWRRCHELARRLGRAHYLDLYAEMKGIDYLALRAKTDAFLQDTAGLYERSVDRLARERLGLSLGELSYADMPYLWRATAYDDVFAADRLVGTLRATLAGMGIDLDAQANVHLDTEVRELKTPRAFCAPVRVPDEIYLVVYPQGGQEDYGALLHEGGHTEHFAHVAPDLCFEYRRLGDNAVTEAFAFLFDHLVLNRAWLAHHVGFEESADFVRFATVSDLFYLRRYAAKLAYETELHAQDGSLDAMAAAYRRRLSEALMVDVPAENYLADVDGGLYVASYLRAWMLEGALRMMLQDRFGQEWFADPEAGAWIKNLWSLGQKFTAEQLLLKNDGGILGTDQIRHHIERTLGR